MQLVSSLVACGALAAVVAAGDASPATALRTGSPKQSTLNAFDARASGAFARRMANKAMVGKIASSEPLTGAGAIHAETAVKVATDTYGYVVGKLYGDSSCSSFEGQAAMPFVTSCKSDGSTSEQYVITESGGNVVVTYTTYADAACSTGASSPSVENYDQSCHSDTTIGGYVKFESATSLPTSDLYNMGSCSIAVYPDANFGGNGLSACNAGDEPLYYYQSDSGDCMVMGCMNDADNTGAMKGVTLTLGSASMDSPAPTAVTSLAAMAVTLAAIAAAAF